MISFFPDFYPDELVYSLLSRYYVKTGYTSYIFAAEDLYEKKSVKPDIEFINQLKIDVLEVITKNISMETIIKEHTMFSYYGRFLKAERRKKAYEALLTMNGSVYNLLPIPTNKNNEKRYLRICPYCVEEDREKYGETYWHRLHQMIGVNICPIHNCKLINSSIIISSRSSPVLKTAEAAIDPFVEKIISENTTEIKLAKYVAKVFQSDIDIEQEVFIGRFLHTQMYGTKYLSVRGKQRNMRLICSDFQVAFKELNIAFKESWQIQKILTGHKTHTYEVCAFAMFINVSPEKLVNMRMPERTQEEIFDKKIKELHRKGIKYPEIAKILNAYYGTVKSIGANLYGTYHSKSTPRKKKENSANKWEQIDINTLPLVAEAIEILNGNEELCPKKITVSAVEKFLNLPCKRIYNLPLCKKEILKYKKIQEEFWAQKIEWAAKKIIKENTALNMKKLRTLTNMKKENIISCIPYIADRDIREKIKNVLV